MIMTNKTKLIAFGVVLVGLSLAALFVLAETHDGVRGTDGAMRQTLDPRAMKGGQGPGSPELESEPDAVVTREQVSPTATTGSLLVTVRWPQGDPAPGIAVSFRTDTRGLSFTILERAVSDERGQIRADGLPAGALRLRSDSRRRMLAEEFRAG